MMTPETRRAHRWMPLLGALTLIALWLGALAVDGSARMMFRTLYSFGADFPEVTLLVLAAVRGALHLILAAAMTVLLAYTAKRRPGYFLHACVAICLVSAMVVSLAMFALVILPSMHCNFEWPSLDAKKGADAKGSLQSGSCGGV